VLGEEEEEEEESFVGTSFVRARFILYFLFYKILVFSFKVKDHVRIHNLLIIE
jgi:hypothetical protein